jgi:hypothetical protein
MYVVAVGGDHIVVAEQRREGADGDRLLSYIEVAETADLAHLVHLAGAFLEPTAEDHPLEHLDQRGSIETQELIRLSDLCCH